MQRHFPFYMKLGVAFLVIIALFSISTSSGSASSSQALRRYPYLTDVVESYATINWATDRSDTAGVVRFGEVRAETCTSHYVPATKTAITVNGVDEYQWKARLNLNPDTQYCYRVYLGTSPVNEIDLLSTDPSPRFWTQVPAGVSRPFSFVVFGDWGLVDSLGENSHQASLMSLIASSGSRFAITTGDNGYPNGDQKNFGDLIQKGLNISTIFGPTFWKVPGASLPIFPTLGNHGFHSNDDIHPFLNTWPQDMAVLSSNGRYELDTHCCLDDTHAKTYPSAWYAFDAGPARFYLLSAAWDESNIGTASEYQVDYDYHWTPGSPQFEWLKADLAAHSCVLKFAFFHYPIYSDNPYESSDLFLQGSNNLEGLLKENGVDIAFTSHAHIYERNLPGSEGVFNYITGGGGGTLGTLGTCTALDAYAIKFTTTGRSCGGAPVPTSADQVYHFLKVTVDGYDVTVTPINALGNSFDVIDYDFSSDAESIRPLTPDNLLVSAVSGTQIDLSWSHSSDNTGVMGYGIYRDGNLLKTVGSTDFSYADHDLVPSKTYTYRVDAFDGSGNRSILSASKSAKTLNTATYKFQSIADTYVAEDFASTNFGSTTKLNIDGSPKHNSYLRFNINDIEGAITNATLRLYTTSTSSTGYQVHRVIDQTWEESSVTYDDTLELGSLAFSSGNYSAGTWTNVDITPFITGEGVLDLALTSDGATNTNLNSRDATSNRPELIIKTIVDNPTCYALTVGHTGQGSDPVASPANSDGCPTGEYTAGVTINLNGATPNNGWYIADWTGTDNDISMANSNIVEMTANNHSVNVNYLNLSPVVLSSTRASGSPTSGPVVDFTVTFSEPVTGVDKSDFSLASTVSNASITSVAATADPAVYTVTVGTGSEWQHKG